MQKIHGHKIIEFLNTMEQTIDKNGMIKAIDREFGVDSTYHNCKSDGMSSEEIVSFFEKKGKLCFTDAGFKFGVPQGCKH